ncbi:MAG TPA: ABC transporter ATP-binding protein [Chloroflexota bacterium]|nr:ABC transporter ATP-binding protein [Chloroflexota bacterium]
MAEPHIRLTSVSKRFGPAGQNPPAVDDVSLEVPRGSFTTLLGPSGCGKTTTLRMIAGFYEPDVGDIFIGDRRINDVPAHRRGTAMVFQDYALFPHMSVADNVGYGLKLAGMKTKERQIQVAETLRFLGLTGLDARSPSQLSGGQQQRVALARALVMKPEVLLLDEPLSNLDAKLRLSIRDELTSIQKQLGITTIYVTHDQDEAVAMSDWVAVMNAGKVVQWGPPWDIYYHPRTPLMADFVGTVNLVKGVVAAAEGDAAHVRVGGEEIVVPGDWSSLAAGREVVLSIRPESLRVTAPDDGRAQACPDAGGGATFSGEVVRHTFLGRLMRYAVRSGDLEWLVDQPDPGAGAPLEGPVLVRVNATRVHIIPDAG